MTDIVSAGAKGKGSFVFGDGRIKFDGEWIEVMKDLTEEEKAEVDKIDKELKKKKPVPKKPGEEAIEEDPFKKFKVKRKHGNGKYADGETIYEGEFNLDKMHGKGKLIFADGSHYEGEFKDNQFDGQGIFVWEDKSKYTGQWVKNRMHGNGCYLASDGKEYSGNFYNGTGKNVARKLGANAQ